METTCCHGVVWNEPFQSRSTQRMPAGFTRVKVTHAGRYWQNCGGRVRLQVWYIPFYEIGILDIYPCALIEKASRPRATFVTGTLHRQASRLLCCFNYTCKEGSKSPVASTLPAVSHVGMLGGPHVSDGQSYQTNPPKQWHEATIMTRIKAVFSLMHNPPNLNSKQ